MREEAETIVERDGGIVGGDVEVGASTGCVVEHAGEEARGRDLNQGCGCEDMELGGAGLAGTPGEWIEAARTEQGP